MKQPLITITTDFGDQFAAAQLRVVIAAQGYSGQIIENHGVTPFSTPEGAFQLSVLAKFAQRGSIHVGIIDPGVGSWRRGIILKTKRSWYVGPDNGVLFPAASKEHIVHVWKLHEAYFGQVSSTFHGRDVFVKAATLLATGTHPRAFRCTEIAPDSLETLHFQNGQIVHIDAYGNVKIFWEKPIHTGCSLCLRVRNRQFKLPVVSTFSDVQQGQPLALAGSSGTLELSVNQGLGSTFFGLSLGEIVEITSCRSHADKLAIKRYNTHDG